ncbi:MAG: TolC family protein, partial [Bacteroidales bacterium]
MCIRNIQAQQTYTLEQVIRYAQESSPEAMKNATSKENKYWQWRTYKSNYKPKLILNTIIPAYQNNNVPVTQSDGSVVYHNINQSNSYMNLALEQNIGLTGGKLFVSSDINRFDDFNKNSNSYNGSPVFIGLEQPLYAFNNLKWMKHIEPLKYDESLKEFIEGYEKIAYNAAFMYFNLLISQINYQIAYTNKSNADIIYKIGQEKYAMGKISTNELLQLKYGAITAQKSIATANLSIKTSLLELSSFTGISANNDMILTPPDSIYIFSINDSLALQKAQDNSRRSIEFKREIFEARRDAEKAHRESRLQASFYVTYGQTNTAPYVRDIYNNPQSMQTLNVGVSIPILDWGRSKASRKTAEANLKLVEYTVQQNQINFRQEVITEIESFKMLQNFIEYTAEADKTAAERYEIARLRYMADNISLTDYNIALEEKDRA